MQSPKRNKYVMAFWMLISSIVLLELMSFLVIFFGIIGTMGYLAVKEIMINEISYTLFLISLILFFLFLSFKKGKKLLLISSFIFFIGGVTDISKMKIQQQKPSFEDHFEKGLKEHWLIQNYSFPENGCEMLDSQVSIESSILTISVDINNVDNEKPYIGGEIGSQIPFLYGSFTVRMKNEIASGTISSFFLMNKWRAENWEHKEIDIEFLGKNKNEVQFTVHHYKDGGKNHVYKKHTYLLGFDSSDDFHDYSIIWNHDSIAWLIDGKWACSEKNILIDEEMYIRMNHWAATPSNVDFMNWLGDVDRTKLPSKSYFDYVKYDPLK